MSQHAVLSGIYGSHGNKDVSGPTGFDVTSEIDKIKLNDSYL